MSDTIKYPWQQLVLDAFLAPRDALSGKINIAERAIAARLKDAQQPGVEERIALKDALRALQVLLGETRAKPTHPDDLEREDLA